MSFILFAPRSLSGAEGPNASAFPSSSQFKDVAVFEFVSGHDAHGVLEIQNLLGQRLEILIDKPISKGVLIRVEYRPVNQIPSVLIYKLKLDDVVYTGKLIYNGTR